MVKRRTAARPLLTAIALLALFSPSAAQSQQRTDAGKKPNIVVIFGDDIGQSNVSAYSLGVMGYRTPNIERISTRSSTR